MEKRKRHKKMTRIGGRTARGVPPPPPPGLAGKQKNNREEGQNADQGRYLPPIGRVKVHPQENLCSIRTITILAGRSCDNINWKS